MIQRLPSFCYLVIFGIFNTMINRRSFLTMTTAALAGAHLKTNAFDMNQTPNASFDHIIFAVSNLEAGIRIIKEKTGVEAVVGGKHPHIGTQNALLSLGHDVYLEILSPDPNGTLIKEYQFITNLHEGKLIQWAAHTSDIEGLLKAANDNGFKNSGINPGRRNTPEGKTLTWQTLMVQTQVDEVMPFFIQWGIDTPHPATTSPRGCSLKSVTLSHPDAALVKKTFKTFGITNDVLSGPVRMTMKIGTPKGDIVL
jgi:hypothetical protein